MNNNMKNLSRNNGKRAFGGIRTASFVLLSVLTLWSGSMRAQVFLMEDDNGANIRLKESESFIPVPYQGTSLDEYLYAPLGEGWLLLAGLGGAYLLRKKSKKEKSEHSKED
jgi:hypothetical protein